MSIDMDKFQEMLKLLEVDVGVIYGEETVPDKRVTCELAYTEAVKSFLAGQDFLRLGRTIQGHQWHMVLSNSARMKNHCEELGITCFDNYLAGIRAAARRQDMKEALQIMSRITAKRVMVRNLLAEEREECDI